MLTLRQVPGSSTVRDQFAKILFHPMAVSGILLYFSLLERLSEPALIRLRCHAQKHSKSKSSCHLHKRNPNKIWLKLGKQQNTNIRIINKYKYYLLRKLWRFYRRFVWQRLIKSGHNLASLLQTTLSPKQALPVLQMNWTNHVVNREPYGLMDNRTTMLGLEKWSIQHFGGILRHFQRRLPRDGCYAAHAVREYQLVPSLRCGPIPNERPWELWHRFTKATRLNRIRWFTKLLRGKTSKKSKCQGFCPSKLKAPQFGSFPKLSFWASSFCLQLEIRTNTLSPKLTFVQIICCFYAQSFGFVSEDVWVLQHMGHKSATLDLAFDKSQQNYGEFCLLWHEWHGWQMEAFRRLPSYL